MQRSGSLDLPLHTGKAPRWLFEKMKYLARGIVEVILIERGRDFLLARLSEPFWFQCFGCILGFDWHSSGLTTTVCGALKEALRHLDDAGIYVCGGKGATSRKTPEEISSIAGKLAKDPTPLIYSSKMVAKVDNNALQDGFDLYHHTFIFTDDFKWTVIQQGMRKEGVWARRYHWYSEDLRSFVNNPHRGIIGDASPLTLNMVDDDIDSLHTMVTQLSHRPPEENIKEVVSLQENINSLPRRHQILLSDVNPKYLDKIFLTTYERKPNEFLQLLHMDGVGKKTIRALALISDLIYGEKVSFRDPARFSFAHGGKDGYPYRIKLEEYQKSIDILDAVVKEAKLQRTDKIKALRRLHRFYARSVDTKRDDCEIREV